jgi:hypothetical protein
MEERAHCRSSWDDYFIAVVKIVGMRGSYDRLYTGVDLVGKKITTEIQKTGLSPVFLTLNFSKVKILKTAY